MANRTNQFAPWATGANAFALSPEQFLQLPARDLGFGSGQVNKYHFNAVLRQQSTIAAMIGQFIVDRANVDALDNGDIKTLEANFEAALRIYIGSLNLSTDQVSSAVTNILNKFTIIGSNVQTFTQTTTWIAKGTRAEVIGQAGGGGGGAGNGYAGAGASGGNAFEGVFDTVPDQVYDIIIGASGTKGVGGQDGGNGGVTSFGPRGGQVLAFAYGGTGGNSGGNPATGYNGRARTPAGKVGIAFPHGGLEYIGGYAADGIELRGVAFIGGTGGGSHFSPGTPAPYGNGSFDAFNFGGGGSGGATDYPGGQGGPGFLSIRS